LIQKIDDQVIEFYRIFLIFIGPTLTITPDMLNWTDFYPDEGKGFDAGKGPAHLADVASDAARRYGDRPAFSTQLPNGDCATLNFREMDEYSGNFAAYLREGAGLGAGDCVALMSPDCLGFVITAMAVFKAGCVCTNINPLYTAPEMAHQLNDSGARVLVIIDLFGDKADAVAGSTAVEQIITISLLDFFSPFKKALMGFVLKRVRKAIPPMRTAHRKFDAVLKEGGRRRYTGIDIAGYRAGQGPDDTALYQYTGGTTGRSKGAELSHRNILANAFCAAALLPDTMNDDPGNCTLVALPLYHITAFALIMLPSFLFGTHGVLIPSPRPPSNLRKAFENHVITHFTGINTLFAALLEELWCTREVLSGLRFCSSGGAAQHVSIAQRWEELSGVPVLQGYGLTEVAGVLTMNTVEDNRLGTVGIPVPGSEVRIADAEGQELPRGEEGEVIARGPTVMKGYLGRPDASRESLKEGWLFTGDIGVMDDDGFVTIVDRKKDMILVSGFCVYPNEVEDAITSLPGVVEAGVIGVPDEKTSEAVKAFVVASDPDLSAAAVIAHCARSLTNYKRPRQVVFVEEIPKSPVGKVLRRELREMDA
jgi:long-chain acyl-CoA synthetase